MNISPSSDKWAFKYICSWFCNKGISWHFLFPCESDCCLLSSPCRQAHAGNGHSTARGSSPRGGDPLAGYRAWGVVAKFNQRMGRMGQMFMSSLMFLAKNALRSHGCEHSLVMQLLSLGLAWAILAGGQVPLLRASKEKSSIAANQLRRAAPSCSSSSLTALSNLCLKVNASILYKGRSLVPDLPSLLAFPLCRRPYSRRSTMQRLVVATASQNPAGRALVEGETWPIVHWQGQ